MKESLLNNPILPALNVKYFVISPMRPLLKHPWLEPVSPTVYQDRMALERAFIVDKFISVSSASLAVETLERLPESLKTVAYLRGANTLFPMSDLPLEKSVEIISYKPEHVSIKASVNKPAALILTDNFYPDWKAFVNGIEKPIYLAQGAFRAVVLGKGTSEIEFKFQSKAWETGILLAVGGLIGSLVFWLFLALKLRGRSRKTQSVL